MEKLYPKQELCIPSRVSVFTESLTLRVTPSPIKVWRDVRKCVLNNEKYMNTGQRTFCA